MRRIALLFVIAVIAAACGDSAGGADPNRFCDLIAELESADNPASMAPDEALEVIQETQRNVDELTSVAPAAIKDDVTTVAALSTKVNDILLDAGGDESQVDDGAMEAIFDEAFTEEFSGATERLDEWTEANCT